jgi:hypothetical protein
MASRPSSRPLRRTTKQQERGFITRQILRRRALHKP